MSLFFTSTKLTQIGAAHSAIETAIATHDQSTYGEPAKLDLAKAELQPLLRAHLGLFNEIAPAFIQQTIEAGSAALSPWVSEAHTREKIVNEYFGLRDIQGAMSSVETSIHNPSAAIAGLRSMARVFSAVLSAPQNQP